MNRQGSDKIGYLDYTWNPIIMKCDRVSVGCNNCWHLKLCNRMAANPIFPDWKRHIYSGDAAFSLDGIELCAPAHVKKPSVIGVQFMGDFFHPAISNSMRQECVQGMIATPQHTYLILTKRLDNIPVWWSAPENIWLGVSAENQTHLHDRWRILTQFFVKVRFISAEPMLSPMRIRGQNPKPDLVICGPETGPGARSCDPVWIQALADDCETYNIPFWDKRKNGIRRELPQ